MSYSIWDNSFTPQSPSVTDGVPITLGVKFQSTVDGYITGLRFYKGANNTGPHVGKLWTSAGTVKATVTFSNETTDGWQEQALDSPEFITSNTTYVASYYSSSGYFSITPSYFSAGGYANGPLVALGDAAAGGNGVYAEPGGADVFPASGGNGANYWVDVVFQPSTVADTNPPTVVAVSPPNGATGVSLRTAVQVTFSKAMDPATLANGITLSSASSGLVASTLTYDPATFKATLTPNSPLALSTVYTVMVANGDTGVKDLAGNPLANAFTSSFTTTDQETYSLWNDSFTPENPSVSDNIPIVLGVRFQSEVDGQILGLRFYKGPNNVGPHVGKLWMDDGTSLATLTFSNETDLGWQEQSFDSPVNIYSNTTYVASYYSPSGYFSITPNYFGPGGYTNDPLVALAGGVTGDNGVFAEPASPDSFPSNNGNGANYWVDVVMVVKKTTDKTPPVISCPPDVILTCTDCNTDPSNTGIATATDDSGSVTVAYRDSVGGACPKVVRRTWTATDPSGNKASCVQTITCVPACLVTEGSGCIFDRDPTTPVQDFRLIFIQDPQNWPCYRLVASNPGQFFYNVFYTGTPGQRVTFNITLPYPFVTQGANPIQGYDWVTVMSGSGQQCLAPGNTFFVSSQQVNLGNYGKKVPAPFTLVPVTLTVPASGVVYLVLHLDYGLKGMSGFTKNLNDDAVDCSTTSRMLIPNYGTYTFAVDGAQTCATSIQNYNSFKRIPGVAGLVQYQGTLDPVPGAVVTLADSKHMPVGSSITDEDGFYMIAYKYTGKAATFYVSLVAPPPSSYTQTQSIKLKSNAFIRADFLVP